MHYILKKPIFIDGLVISEDIINSAIIDTNNYLNNVSSYFIEIELDIFNILGQRNISGFIGEVFSKTLSSKVNGLISNPHQDGRPDIINVSSLESKRFFYSSFLDRNHRIPIKERFSPYPYGGIEIKCSIGETYLNKELKNILLREYNTDKFDIRIPRGMAFSTLTYWGHHRDCSNLLGIYYDYYDNSYYNPQIIALFYAELDQSDWSELSIGKVGSKKTSNTSLNLCGRDKIRRNVVAVIDDYRYINKLKSRGYLP